MWFIRIFTASSIWAGTRRREAAAGLLLATGHRHPLVAKSSWGGSVCLAAAGRERSQQVGVLLPPPSPTPGPCGSPGARCSARIQPRTPDPCSPWIPGGVTGLGVVQGAGKWLHIPPGWEQRPGAGPAPKWVVLAERSRMWSPGPTTPRGAPAGGGPRALRCGSFPSPGESRMWLGMPCAPPHHTSVLQNHGFISHPIPGIRAQEGLAGSRGSSAACRSARSPAAPGRAGRGGCLGA